VACETYCSTSRQPLLPLWPLISRYTEVGQLLSARRRLDNRQRAEDASHSATGALATVPSLADLAPRRTMPASASRDGRRTEPSAAAAVHTTAPPFCVGGDKSSRRALSYLMVTAVARRARPIVSAVRCWSALSQCWCVVGVFPRLQRQHRGFRFRPDLHINATCRRRRRLPQHVRVGGGRVVSSIASSRSRAPPARFRATPRLKLDKRRSAGEALDESRAAALGRSLKYFEIPSGNSTATLSPAHAYS